MLSLKSTGCTKREDGFRWDIAIPFNSVDLTSIVGIEVVIDDQVIMPTRVEKVEVITQNDGTKYCIYGDRVC